MNAPMTPPSNRIVSPGHRSRCASVAASSGTPTPANTTWPSLSWRALRIVRSSAAVWHSLAIGNGLPRAGGLQQVGHADQIEELRPRFRTVDKTVQIFLHARHRILVHQADVVLHVPHHRLVDAVAFVRRAPEGQLNH